MALCCKLIRRTAYMVVLHRTEQVSASSSMLFVLPHMLMMKDKFVLDICWTLPSCMLL